MSSTHERRLPRRIASLSSPDLPAIGADGKTPMKCSLSTRLVAVAIASSSLVGIAAEAQMRVGVIASATGPTAVVGIPQKNTAALLPTCHPPTIPASTSAARADAADRRPLADHAGVKGWELPWHW